MQHLRAFFGALLALVLIPALLVFLLGCTSPQDRPQGMGWAWSPTPYSPSLEFQRWAHRAIDNHDLAEQLRRRGIKH